MVDIQSKFFNIPLSCSFWDVLAESYLRRYQNDTIGLSSVLFMLPNRRACQSLVAAFVRLQGLVPAVLPQIIPIAEIDDDELFFNSFSWNDIGFDIKSTISQEERLFLFARMIMSKPNDFGLKQISLAQAINLAIDLANLIDTASNLNLSFDKLYELVPEKYATHWQETLKLLKIITEYWPQILVERQSVDVCELKNTLLYKQAEYWQRECTKNNIVIAGITANFPAIVNMLKVVSQLPNGEVYFAGIDLCADDDYWQAIDESHPQFELKELLHLLEIDRSQIANLCPAKNLMREKFISEVMRPARVSDDWLNLDGIIDVAKATSGISLIESPSQRDEASAIALKMREVLSIPEKTVALITYDRGLARRVATELKRFNIQIDDSAGIPLPLSSIGIYLRLITEASEDTNSQVKFINLLKHPFTLCGLNAADFRQRVYDYELSLRNKKFAIAPDFINFFQCIKNDLAEFSTLINSENIAFKDILIAHIRLAEKFAASCDAKGESNLWRGDAGKCAASFVVKMLDNADTLGNINGRDYPALISELMGLESVRTSYGTHPRLSILGPIEARLCHFDYVILGEINEGIWPKPADADMWMSRPMKRDFGFSLPEKSIGILGADLCVFLASENVILTRAERIDGVPMKKSRWLLRLETVLAALNSDIEALRLNDFSLFASQIDKPKIYTPIKSPSPCPPVYARPRVLSASAVDLLITDPYSVFAKYILRLYPLDDLDIPLDQRDYGTLIHGIIEDFNNTYPCALPDDALDKLLKLGERHFDSSNIEREVRAFWWPKFVNTAISYLALENRDEVVNIYNEVSGEITYSLAQGTFKFTAKADRIDKLSGDKINIIDYKTGAIPSKKQVMSGHALQLLLEGIIAQKGGFTGIPQAEVRDLIYWHLGGKSSSKNRLIINPKEDDVLNRCEEFLVKLANTFDFETTPYYSHPIPKFVSKNKDYEHLARVKEWSVSEEDSSNGD